VKSQLEAEKRDTFFSPDSSGECVRLRADVARTRRPIVGDCSRMKISSASRSGPAVQTGAVSSRLGFCPQRTSFPPRFLGLIIDRTTRQVPGTFPVLPRTSCSSCVSLARPASPSRISLSLADHRRVISSARTLKLSHADYVIPSRSRASVRP